MRRLGRSLCLAAISAVAAAGTAAAEVEPATLQFADGVFEGEKIRVAAGEVDGRGLVFVEYYRGAALRMTVPYSRVYVDDESTDIRRLTDLALTTTQNVDGFAFSALDGATSLACTILLHSDATITCTRAGSGYVSPIAPACAASFKGWAERNQCDGIRQAFAGKGFDDDALVATCAATFRGEIARNYCIMYAYNHPAEFDGVRRTCAAAYQTEDERNFCFYFSLAPADPADRMPVAHVQACDALYDDDKLTTACAFTLKVGKPASETRLSPDRYRLKPHEKDTFEVVPAAPITASVSGATIEVRTGTYETLSVRVTGGMVGSEPLITMDAYAKGGEHQWMMMLDRIVIGREKQARALRELSLVEKVKASGNVITFKAVRAGKKLSCRANVVDSWATCR